MAGHTKKNRIVLGHQDNFNTLIDAVKAGRVCLMDCIENATGEHVAVICCVNNEANGEIGMVPMAKFFNGNPYELLTSPLEYEIGGET